MGRRVVSLLPSATETVAALGHVADLVGRSHECDHPEAVRELPVVSRPRRDPVGTSAEIHRGVVELLADVLSIYEVDTDALRRADPDLIITQDLCQVCAVPEEAVVAAARDHLDREVEVLTSSPLTLDEVLGDIARIARALQDPQAGERLLGKLRAGFDTVRAAVAGRDRPRLALLEWTDPLMAGGNWAPELARIAGAQPVLGAAGQHSAWIGIDELRSADPDVIVVLPCGYDLERAEQERPVLERLDGWRELRAVEQGRVAFADGSAYFNRPGPRLVDSAAILAAIVHGVGPGTILEGRGWRWW